MRGRGTLLLLVVLALCLGSVGWALLTRSQPSPLPAFEVEVLNGCGENGLAAEVAATLRGLGQDVVRVGDATHHDHEVTVLVDRRGRPSLVKRLADRLGGPLVVLERLDEPQADITLILGKDHGELALTRNP